MKLQLHPEAEEELFQDAAWYDADRVDLGDEFLAQAVTDYPETTRSIPMVQIRRASVEDAVILWKAEVETAKTAGRLVSRPHELNLASFESRIRELGGTGCYLVAFDDDGPCGHAVLEPMPLEALQHVLRLTIVVHPGRTGHGIGTALLTNLQEWARSHAHVRKIELLVRATNVGAVRLYERLGFVEEGRLRDRVALPDGNFTDDIAMAWFPR